MAQCQGMTKKGERCKREAPDGSAYCSIHLDQEVRARSTPVDTEWDREAVMMAALGFALVGAIVLLHIRR